MKFRFLLIAGLLISLTTLAQDKPKEAYPFQSEIKAYQSQDSTAMPKPGGYLFIGSSSIRKWVNLPKHFPDKPIVMRGVGGSTIAQWVQYYMPTMVYPYKPSRIYIYVGDNDLAAGATAKDVCDNFVNMLGMIKQKLPNTRVYFMCMKLSPSRAKYYSAVGQGDQMIADYIKTQSNTVYIDANTPLLNPKALPDSAYFQKDMLHLNLDGYDKWEKMIADYLK